MYTRNCSADADANANGIPTKTSNSHFTSGLGYKYVTESKFVKKSHVLSRLLMSTAKQLKFMQINAKSVIEDTIEKPRSIYPKYLDTLTPYNV